MVLFFCSKECKNKAQSFLGNCPEIRPSHYKDGKWEYANSAFTLMRNNDKEIKCQCGENKEYLLVVHHIDGNRNNNPLDVSNWEIVCFNCHAKRHLKFENGKWIFDTKYLTPRDMLDKI